MTLVSLIEVSRGPTCVVELACAREGPHARLFAEKRLVDPSDPRARAIFVSAAERACRARHPNLVPSVAVDARDGQPALRMAVVEGPTLATLIARCVEAGELLPAATAVDVTRRVAAALAAVHAQGDQAHGGPTPENVVVEHDGAIRLTGVAMGVALAGARSGALDLAVLGATLVALLGAGLDDLEEEDQSELAALEVCDRRGDVPPWLLEIALELVGAPRAARAPSAAAVARRLADRLPRLDDGPPDLGALARRCDRHERARRRAELAKALERAGLARGG